MITKLYQYTQLRVHGTSVICEGIWIVVEPTDRWTLIVVLRSKVEDESPRSMTVNQ
jgi:hypothetical protein